jgi:hypothetical protein
MQQCMYAYVHCMYVLVYVRAVGVM